MVELSTERRKSLPKKEFGLPGERKYPMPDRSHAANAKARASEEEHKGKISEGEEREIDAKADRKLGEHGEERNRKIGAKLRGREGDNESRHGTGGGFFGHPHGHSPANVMPHPAGDGHLVIHTHGGISHHHADGSVTHHDGRGQWLASEGGEHRRTEHQAMNPTHYGTHYETGQGHHEQMAAGGLSYPHPGVGSRQYGWR